MLKFVGSQFSSIKANPKKVRLYFKPSARYRYSTNPYTKYKLYPINNKLKECNPILS